VKYPIPHLIPRTCLLPLGGRRSFAIAKIHLLKYVLSIFWKNSHYLIQPLKVFYESLPAYFNSFWGWRNITYSCSVAKMGERS